MEEDISRDYTHRLLACAYNVHSELGPGLLESVYEKALGYELRQAGFTVATQVPVKVMYRGMDLGGEMRLDLLVDDKVVVELKSVQELLPVHYKQLLTYMRLKNVQLGYLINFNVASLREGIHRVRN